jgi:hypothetical protein
MIDEKNMSICGIPKKVAYAGPIQEATPMTKLDILGYPPTKQEQELIATIRKTDYGEVVIKIKGGKPVLLTETKTIKKESFI